MSNTDKKGIIQPTPHNPLELTYRYTTFAREFIRETIHEGLEYAHTSRTAQQSIDKIMILRVHSFINYANYKGYE